MSTGQRPHLPEPAPVPTYLITSAQPPQAPACTCHQHPTPVPAAAPRRPVAPSLIAGTAAVGGVVAVVTVLTALLLAVAVTAVSVAVCAVVLRHLVGQSARRR